MQVIVTSTYWVSDTIVKSLEKEIEKYLKESEGIDEVPKFRFFNPKNNSSTKNIEVILSHDILKGKSKKLLFSGVEQAINKALLVSHTEVSDVSVRTSNFPVVDADLRIAK